MHMHSRFIMPLAIALLIASQTAWPQGRAARLGGKIEQVNGPVLRLNSAEGQIAVNILPATRVYAQATATLADIRPGSFLGVGAMPQQDGSQQAIRVMIFPEAMRGQGEGHRPWDRPGSTMTNATVDTAVTSISGQVLTVKYQGGEQKIVVRPDAQILTYVELDRQALKPGASVSVSGRISAAGTMDADRIIVTR